MMLSDVSVCLTSGCLSVAYIGPKSRTERRRKTKIGTEVAQGPKSHVTRTPFSRSKGQRSMAPGRFTHRGVYASGSCSGERGNVLAVGTYCYVAVCTLQALLARRREALRRPQREEMGGGMNRHGIFLFGPACAGVIYLLYYILSFRFNGYFPSGPGYMYNNYYCIKTRKGKWETDRNRVVRELCIRSHRHTYNYQVCSYTWSVPYTRRCLSHTRPRLHNRTVLRVLRNALMNIIKLLISYTAVTIGLLVVIHAEHIVHRRGYCFHFGCMYVCMFVCMLAL